MKKTTMLLLIVACAFTAQSQLSSGRMMLGLNVNYSGSTTNQLDTLNAGNTDVQKQNNLNANLRFGYFLTDHIMLGVYTSYASYGTKNDIKRPGQSNFMSTRDLKTTAMYYGLFGRYYQMLGESKFAFFGQLSVGAGNGSTSDKRSNSTNGVSTANPDITSKSSYFEVALNPGIVYFVNNRFGVEASIGNIKFMTDKTDNFVKGHRTGGYTSSDTYFSFSPSTLYLGVSLYFGGGSGETKK